MARAYLRRGITSGAVAGLAFGLFVVLVVRPLVRYAETFEAGSSGGAKAGLLAGSTLVSLLGSVLLGLLLGAVVFGAGYYLLEPAIPGRADTKSYLLGAAGFVTLSGAPWLFVPPQPPGVEAALAVEARLAYYALGMALGAAACALSALGWTRWRTRHGRVVAGLAALAPPAVLVGLAILAPGLSVAGPVPEGLAAAFRGIVAVGQVGLWLVMAGTHAWLLARRPGDETSATARSRAVDVAGRSATARKRS